MVRKILLFATLPLLSFATTTYAQGFFHISGKVLSENGKEIPHANVEVRVDKDWVQIYRTDSSGSFELGSLPKGQYYLRVSAPGYLSKDIHPPIKKNINIRLHSYDLTSDQVYHGEYKLGAESINESVGSMDVGLDSVSARIEASNHVAVPTDIKLDYSSSSLRAVSDFVESATSSGSAAIVQKLKPSWNRWAEDGDGKPVESMEVGYDYTVRFDLAGVDYSELVASNLLSASPTDDAVRALLSDPKLKRLQILIKPFVENDAVSFLFDENRARRDVIKLDRMRDTVRIANTLRGVTDIGQVSALLSATSIAINVHAEHSGCARLGFVLWDAALRHPLDVVRTNINVTQDDAPAKASCRGNAKAQPLSAGIAGTLLSSVNMPQADAGLFVFELSSGEASDATNTAIFVGPDNSVLSWNPSRDLTTYVYSADAGSISDQLQQAQQADCLNLQGRQHSCVEDFSGIGGDLASVLFSDPHTEGNREAAKALASLNKMFTSSESLPKIVFRFTDTTGETKPFPFGLLRLSSGRLVGDVATILQSLPIERYNDDSVCVASWTNIIPSSLGTTQSRQQVVPTNFLQPIEPSTSPLLRSWDDLMGYFSEKKSVKPGAEGLLLVAHHVAGSITFDLQGGKSLVAEDIKKSYLPGSVAVLASCATGSLTSVNRGIPLVTILNAKGVDAMVVASFEVTAALAARFAVNFAHQVDFAESRHLNKSLLQLFESARSATQSEALVFPFLSELAGFSLVGDSNLKLCTTP